MKLIFIGGLYRKEIQNEINKKSKRMPYFAANNHQWAIVDGLEKVNPNNNILLNSMHIKSFPIYKEVCINSKNWSHNNKAKNKDVGFFNVSGIKHIWRSIALTIELKKTIMEIEDQDISIVTYGIHNPFLIAAYFNRKYDEKNIKWCSIIPEVPLFYIGTKGKSWIYNTFKKLDWFISLKLLKKADIYQLLTDNMASFLEIAEDDYIVIEGIMDTEFDSINDISYVTESTNKKTVLYTGTTNIEFGIIDLLRAFRKIEGDEYELIICGTGNGDEEIMKNVLEDKRINWKGFVSREEVVCLQREATVLINPRRPDLEFTLYSFPSKTMEYLYSGTPVLMHKLNGIPNEYEPYINWFKSTDTEDISKLIIEVCDWSKQKRDDYAVKTKNFIKLNKSLEPQGKKLFDFISSQF